MNSKYQTPCELWFNISMTKEEIFEESLLLAADSMAVKAQDQGTKILVDLFKSLVLEKYKDAFDEELAHGEVHRKNISKAMDFCYADICVAIRRNPQLPVEKKESLIQKGKELLPGFKEIVKQIHLDKGFKVV